MARAGPHGVYNPHVSVRRLLPFAVIIVACAAGIVNDREPDNVPIIFFGDSLTLGWLASGEDREFASILRSRLADNGAIGSRRVISALGGMYVDLLISQEVGRRPRSLIIVELGAHSVIEDPNLNDRTFRIGYGAMLDCLRGSGARVVVATVPWLGWDAGGGQGSTSVRSCLAA